MSDPRPATIRLRFKRRYFDEDIDYRFGRKAGNSSAAEMFDMLYKLLRQRRQQMLLSLLETTPANLSHKAQLRFPHAQLSGFAVLEFRFGDVLMRTSVTLSAKPYSPGRRSRYLTIYPNLYLHRWNRLCPNDFPPVIEVKN